MAATDSFGIQRWRLLMRSMNTQRGLNKLVACLMALAIMAGCASTSVSDQQQMVAGPLPRPGQIWVYPFAATPADVRPESELTSDPEVVAGQQSPEVCASSAPAM